MTEKHLQITNKTTETTKHAIAGATASTTIIDKKYIDSTKENRFTH